jgi:hypothetical protein
MTRCEARTSDGTRCKCKAMGDQKKCYQHSDKCPICLERIGQGDDTSTLVCGHSFHATCVYHWFDRANTCPMCRFPVKKMTIEVEHDPILDDPWSHIPVILRELVTNGQLRLSERVRIGTSLTFSDSSGNVLRTLNLS